MIRGGRLEYFAPYHPTSVHGVKAAILDKDPDRVWTRLQAVQRETLPALVAKGWSVIPVRLQWDGQA